MVKGGLKQACLISITGRHVVFKLLITKTFTTHIKMKKKTSFLFSLVLEMQVVSGNSSMLIYGPGEWKHSHMLLSGFKDEEEEERVEWQ